MPARADPIRPQINLNYNDLVRAKLAGLMELRFHHPRTRSQDSSILMLSAGVECVWGCWVGLWPQAPEAVISTVKLVHTS